MSKHTKSLLKKKKQIAHKDIAPQEGKRKLNPRKDKTVHPLAQVSKSDKTKCGEDVGKHKFSNITGVNVNWSTYKREQFQPSSFRNSGTCTKRYIRENSFQYCL